MKTTQRICDRCGAVLFTKTYAKRDGVPYVVVNRDVQFVPVDAEARTHKIHEDLCIACTEADPALKAALAKLQHLPEA